MKSIVNFSIKGFILILVFGLFHRADCSRESQEPVCYMSDEFKEYIVFGSGSFWIYQHQAGYLDTVIVQDAEIEVSDSPYNYPAEIFSYYRNSSMRGREYFLAQCESDRIGCSGLSSLAGGKFWPIMFFCCCEEALKVGNLTYLGIDSMTIHGIHFPELKYFESDSLYPNSYHLLHYAKGIGLVKYTDYYGDEWELIEFSLNKSVRH